MSEKNKPQDYEEFREKIKDLKRLQSILKESDDDTAHRVMGVRVGWRPKTDKAVSDDIAFGIMLLYIAAGIVISSMLFHEFVTQEYVLQQILITLFALHRWHKYYRDSQDKILNGEKVFKVHFLFWPVFLLAHAIGWVVFFIEAHIYTKIFQFFHSIDEVFGYFIMVVFFIPTLYVMYKTSLIYDKFLIEVEYWDYKIFRRKESLRKEKIYEKERDEIDFFQALNYNRKTKYKKYYK